LLYQTTRIAEEDGLIVVYRRIVNKNGRLSRREDGPLHVKDVVRLTDEYNAYEPPLVKQMLALCDEEVVSQVNTNIIRRSTDSSVSDDRMSTDRIHGDDRIRDTVSTDRTVGISDRRLGDDTISTDRFHGDEMVSTDRTGGTSDRAVGDKTVSTDRTVGTSDRTVGHETTVFASRVHRDVLQCNGDTVTSSRDPIVGDDRRSTDPVEGDDSRDHRQGHDSISRNRRAVSASRLGEEMRYQSKRGSTNVPRTDCKMSQLFNVLEEVPGPVQGSSGTELTPPDELTARRVLCNILSVVSKRLFGNSAEASVQKRQR